MSWRLRVVHTLGYAYNFPVRASFNEVRINPRNDSRQNAIVGRVTTNPATRYYRYSDYWGTFVTAFDLHAPHSKLEIVGTAVVETELDGEVEKPLNWDKLASPRVTDRYYEYLGYTELVPNHRPLLGVARRLRKQDLSPEETVQAVAEWVKGEFEFVPYSSGAHATAVDAVNAGRGTHRDLAHVSLALLRGLGVPARYVTGYVHPDAKAKIGDVVEGRTWAWFEAWYGAWRGFDPVSGAPITERHIAVGQGRDYADVPPIKGIYTGGVATDLDVHVEITRLA
ncbi:MAG: transglutaminase family protein [Segniliparus sp.]|uniref:transglutaminase family protein n=1 Tax=Segniliparus sp. TaxID=2804064 RepID=UPI003F3BCB8A